MRSLWPATSTESFEHFTRATTTDSAAKSGEKPKVEVNPDMQTNVILVFLVFIQVALVTLVYGPIAAYLVEMFPTRIRYTSMSLPYHIGNGVFGGLVPFIATALVAKTGNPLMGLSYPIGIALLTLVVGLTLVGKDAVASEEEPA